MNSLSEMALAMHLHTFVVFDTIYLYAQVLSSLCIENWGFDI
jgi:hypothetical protein